MQKTDLKIKAKELVEKFMPHAKNWDCYHDEPLEENHAKYCALIAVNMEYDARISAYKELVEFCPDVSVQAAIYAQREREQLIKEIENL